MRIVSRKRRTDPSVAQKMLTATPAVGKAFLTAGFALIFGLGLLIVEIGWVVERVQFGLDQWLFTLVMIALLAGSILLGRRIPRAIKLERAGRRAEGYVVGGWREADDESERFFLAFAVDDLTFKQQVNQRHFSNYEPGDRVSVIQLADQPEIARMIFP